MCSLCSSDKSPPSRLCSNEEFYKTESSSAASAQQVCGCSRWLRWGKWTVNVIFNSSCKHVRETNLNWIFFHSVKAFSSIYFFIFIKKSSYIFFPQSQFFVSVYFLEVICTLENSHISVSFLSTYFFCLFVLPDVSKAVASVLWFQCSAPCTRTWFCCFRGISTWLCLSSKPK